MSAPSIVIPAQAGIHILSRSDGAATFANMDSRLRGNDEWML
jgi:hypothetical protein